eukprot:scaffold8023_cov103-Isochrysis_galbana.AAC.15
MPHASPRGAAPARGARRPAAWRRAGRCAGPAPGWARPLPAWARARLSRGACGAGRRSAARIPSARSCPTCPHRTCLTQPSSARPSPSLPARGAPRGDQTPRAPGGAERLRWARDRGVPLPSASYFLSTAVACASVASIRSRCSVRRRSLADSASRACAHSRSCSSSTSFVNSESESWPSRLRSCASSTSAALALDAATNRLPSAPRVFKHIGVERARGVRLAREEAEGLLSLFVGRWRWRVTARGGGLVPHHVGQQLGEFGQLERAGPIGVVLGQHGRRLLGVNLEPERGERRLQVGGRDARLTWLPAPVPIELGGERAELLQRERARPIRVVLGHQRGSLRRGGVGEHVAERHPQLALAQLARLVLVEHVEGLPNGVAPRPRGDRREARLLGQSEFSHKRRELGAAELSRPVGVVSGEKCRRLRTGRVDAKRLKRRPELLLVKAAGAVEIVRLEDLSDLHSRRSRRRVPLDRKSLEGGIEIGSRRWRRRRRRSGVRVEGLAHI